MHVCVCVCVYVHVCCVHFVCIMPLGYDDLAVPEGGMA